MGMFLNGLKDEVKADLRLMRPKTLKELMDAAYQVEGRNWMLKKVEEKKTRSHRVGTPVPWPIGKTGFPKFSTLPESQKCPLSSPTSRATEPKGKEGSKITSLSTPTSSNGSCASRSSRRLSKSELNRRRELGLCFKCEEKYSPDHKCKGKQLRLLVFDEEEDEINEGDFTDLEEETEEKEVAIMELLQSTIVGLSGHRTLKVRGLLGRTPVVVLIDSGAIHNFIAQHVVDCLSLTISPTRSYSVTVGDGRKTFSKGVCRDLEVELQGVMVRQNFYPYTLSNIDLVLGMAWLETLGETRINWGQLYMKLKVDDEWVCLKGDPALKQAPATFKAIKKALRGKGEGFLIEIQVLEVSNGGDKDQPENIPLAVTQLLKQYEAVCEAVAGLPPHRHRDHAITIEHGARPPNIRPYRYAFGQKTEIEKLVREMIDAGIIRPSNSPYASPVLLVKKKDGSWRFCV